MSNGEVFRTPIGSKFPLSARVSAGRGMVGVIMLHLCQSRPGRRRRQHWHGTQYMEKLSPADPGSRRIVLSFFLSFCHDVLPMAQTARFLFFTCVAIYSEVRQPSAVIVNVGFLSALLTNGAASVIKRFLQSHA